MPTLEEALEYMGIDYADDVIRRRVTRAMATARQILLGAVGDDVETYLPADPRFGEVILIYTDDLYSERGVRAKVSNATRNLVANSVLQLKLELDRKKEAAGA